MYSCVTELYLESRAPLPPKPKLSDHKINNGEESSGTVHEATPKHETGDAKEGKQVEKHSEGKPESVSLLEAISDLFYQTHFCFL